MQNVSTAWKENQKESFTSEGYVEISYMAVDDASQGAGIVSSNDAVPGLALSALLDPENTDKNTACLGLNNLILDSERTYEAGNVFVSQNISDTSGVFSAPPTLKITWSTLQTTEIIGLTVAWDLATQAYATKFAVTVKNGNTVVYSKTVENNRDVQSVITHNLIGYDSVEIQILEWVFPQSHAIISYVLMGAEQIYDKSKLMKFECSRSGDLLSFELPNDELRFSVDNSDEQFDPNNPAGIFRLLAERQLVKVRYGFKIGSSIEWISGGQYYLSEWEVPANGVTADFTARNVFGFMEDPYTGTKKGTLKQILEAAFNQVDVACSIDASLGAITLPSGADFEGLRVCDVVQYCANAGRCVLYVDHSGTVQVRPNVQLITGYNISEDVSFQRGKYTLASPIKSLLINGETSVSIGAKTGEVKTIDNTFIANAEAVGIWILRALQHRRSISGSWRADPCLDIYDVVAVTNKYSTDTIQITGLDLSFAGSFSGSYTGTILYTAAADAIYSGEGNAGDV